jgi:opacity protein-like surface antigen
MATRRSVALAAVFVIVSAASGSALEGQNPYAPVESTENRFDRNGFYVGLAGSVGITNKLKDVAEEDTYDRLAAWGTSDIGYRVLDQEPVGVNITRVAPVGFTSAQVDLDPGLSIGVTGRVGYRFHPHLSAELQAEWLDGFDSYISVYKLVEHKPATNIPWATGGTPAKDVELKDPEFAAIAVNPWVITGNVKGYLLTGRWQPFLLAGAGLMTAKVSLELNDLLGKDPPGEEPLGSEFRRRMSESDRFTGAAESVRSTGFAARFGAGIDAYATENFVFTLGADYVFPTGDVKDFDYISVVWGVQYRF